MNKNDLSVVGSDADLGARAATTPRGAIESYSTGRQPLEWNQMKPHPQERYNRPGTDYLAQDEPRIFWCRRRRAWITDSDVSWFDRATGQTIRVRAGFETDLASVPFFLVPLVSMYGNWNRAAIVHDALYLWQGVMTSGVKLTRKQCDRIFLDIAIVDGTNPFVAFVGYYGIRLNPLNWPLFKKW